MIWLYINDIIHNFLFRVFLEESYLLTGWRVQLHVAHWTGNQFRTWKAQWRPLLQSSSAVWHPAFQPTLEPRTCWESSPYNFWKLDFKFSIVKICLGFVEPAPLVEVALHLLLQLPLDDGAVGADLQPDLLMLQVHICFFAESVPYTVASTYTMQWWSSRSRSPACPQAWSHNVTKYFSKTFFRIRPPLIPLQVLIQDSIALSVFGDILKVLKLLTPLHFGITFHRAWFCNGMRRCCQHSRSAASQPGWQPCWTSSRVFRPRTRTGCSRPLHLPLAGGQYSKV